MSAFRCPTTQRCGSSSSPSTFFSSLNVPSGRSVFDWMRRRPDSEASDDVLFADANALRAKEVTELSPEARDEVLCEIHGVRSLDEDEESDLPGLLRAFQREVDTTPHKPAYNRAKQLSANYVLSRGLRTMALRAERYDPKRAAVRYIRHFEYKLQLFGLDALARDITQDDLDADDLRSLYLGYYQVLPERDRSGRPIVIMAQEYQDFKSQISQNKLSWYIMMKTLQDPEHGDELQKLGWVGIMYNLDMTEPTKKFIDQAQNGSDYIDSVLVKYSAVHYCYNDVRLHPAMAVFQFALGRHIRMRFRAHYGSHVECQYALASFGIPMHHFGINTSGAIHNGPYCAMLKRYANAEREEAERVRRSGAILPTSKDILLGRGKSFQTFPGNRYLASIVNERRSEAASMTRVEKTRLFQDVVRHIHAVAGGRFLKKVSSEWEVADDATAHEKVAHAFRTSYRGSAKKNAEARMQVG